MVKPVYPPTTLLQGGYKNAIKQSLTYVSTILHFISEMNILIRDNDILLQPSIKKKNIFNITCHFTSFSK
jgi:hypothetical protein